MSAVVTEFPLLSHLSNNRFARLAFWGGIFLLAAVLFGVAYTQSHLYEGNQNTKFLHGLALAGEGFLRQDWLANTTDPLPVFSFLVMITARIAERLFYVYYILLFGVYVIALVGITAVLYPAKKDFTRYFMLFGLLLVVHSKWLLKLFEQKHGLDLSLLHFGLADQYLLGEEFQNSTFGVLLLLSIWLFLQRRYTSSMIATGIAVLLHSAYLFSAALLVAACCLIVLWERLSEDQSSPSGWPRLWRAARLPLKMGLLALAFALPVVAYQQIALASNSPETARQALRILVHERIPHHTQPAVFMNTGAYLQIGLMLIGLLLSRRSRLTVILAALLAGGALGSAIQILTGSDSLALLGPWRTSVLVVPVSTALVFAFLLHFLLDTLRLGKLPYQWLLVPLMLYYIFVAVQAGIENQQLKVDRYNTLRITSFMNHIKQNAQPEDYYLIPPLESEFDDFRVFTRVPILANWKSHPYRDDEVLEWYRRVQIAQSFYAAQGEARCGALQSVLAAYPQINHVVYAEPDQLTCDFLREEYNYTRYTTYAVLK